MPHYKMEHTDCLFFYFILLAQSDIYNKNYYPPKEYIRVLVAAVENII